MKIVLLALADNANDYGQDCFPSLRKICEKCSLSETAAKDQLRELRRLGIISQKPAFDVNGRQRSNNFEISLPKLAELREGAQSDPSPKGGRQPTGEGTPAAPTGGRQPPPFNRTKEPSLETQKEEGVLLAPPDLFDASKPEKAALAAPDVLPDFPAATMVRIWNECVPGAKIQALAGQRKTLAGARWKQLGSSIAEWTLFCQRVGQSPFLTGQEQSRSKRTFTATFDWCILPGNFLKIQEGRYPAKSESKPKSEKPYDW